MKANKKPREHFVRDRRGFTFIIPLTMAIVIGFALLAIGAYVVGTLSSALENTYSDEGESGSISLLYEDDGTIAGGHNMNLTGTNVGELTAANSYFYIQCGASAVDFSLTVNNVNVNRSDNISEGEGVNITFAYFITNSTVNSTDTVISFDYTVSTDDSAIDMVAVGTYNLASDWRSDADNKTIILLGNITDGFADVVDIEIVVIIITALSMAIIAIMAVGSRRQLF